MEKISKIVHGNSRMASTDLKASSAVRPGAPSFGQTVGESPQMNGRTDTTASRASALQNELNDRKRSGGQDQVAEQMADNFFMTRIRRPDEEIGPAAPKDKVSAKDIESQSTDELLMSDTRNAEVTQPEGYKPRGSYVDVHA